MLSRFAITQEIMVTLINFQMTVFVCKQFLKDVCSCPSSSHPGIHYFYNSYQETNCEKDLSWIENHHIKCGTLALSIALSDLQTEENKQLLENGIEVI